MNMQDGIKELELKLKAIKEILDPKNADLFEDINKAIRILEHRNANHYKSIDIKLCNFTRIIYETGILRDLDEEEHSKLTDLLNQASTIAGKISIK